MFWWNGIRVEFCYSSIVYDIIVRWCVRVMLKVGCDVLGVIWYLRDFGEFMVWWYYNLMRVMLILWYGVGFFYYDNNDDIEVLLELLS